MPSTKFVFEFRYFLLYLLGEGAVEGHTPEYPVLTLVSIPFLSFRQRPALFAPVHPRKVLDITGGRPSARITRAKSPPVLPPGVQQQG